MYLLACSYLQIILCKKIYLFILQGPSLPIEEEEELYASAHKQLNVALEFYTSNADKVPLPYPHKLGNYQL